MRCSKCIEYRPKLSGGYDSYTCLACGQAWRLDGSTWRNNGVYDLKSKQKVREDTMADKRDGFKFVTALKGDEYFVSMINYNDTVYVCTNRSIYMLVDECLQKMEIEMQDDDPTRPLPDSEDILVDSPILQIDGKFVNHIGGYLIKKVVIVGDKLVNLIMDWDT